jgi:Fe2+ transport system protein FeoA
MASLWRAFRSQPLQRGLSKKFRVSVEKLPGSRRGIGAMASRISDMGIKPGAIMTITEYLAATVLIALIVWAALGLLMQES